MSGGGGSLGSERFADVSVQFVIPPAVKARVPPLRLHRAVLAARSPVLRTCLQQMKADTCTLDLELGGQYTYSAGLPPLAHFIHYLYTDCLPTNTLTQEITSCLLQLATRFRVPSLGVRLHKHIHQQRQDAQRRKQKSHHASAADSDLEEEEEEENQEEQEAEEEVPLPLRNSRGTRRGAAPPLDEDTTEGAQLARDMAAAMGGAALEPLPFGDVEVSYVSSPVYLRVHVCVCVCIRVRARVYVRVRVRACVCECVECGM